MRLVSIVHGASRLQVCAGGAVGFAMTAAPPEFSVLWAGPNQSKDDGQAAAVMCQQRGDKSFYLPRAPGSLGFHM